MKMKKAVVGEKGLTLLELMVVFTILATTAVLVIPNVQKGVEQKKADSAIASLRKISTCIRLYKQENGGTISSGQLGLLESNTTTFPAANSCYDRSQLAPGFDWNTALPSTTQLSTLQVMDISGANRKVCLRISSSASNQSRGGVIYDYPAGGTCPTNNPCPASSSAFYRCFAE